MHSTTDIKDISVHTLDFIQYIHHLFTCIFSLFFNRGGGFSPNGRKYAEMVEFVMVLFC